jgi:putative flippase GtrA
MTKTSATSSSLLQRLDGISGEVIRFGVVGLGGVAVNFVVFWICINGLGLASLRSNIAATLVAIATNYLGYRYWLYKDRDAASRRREITLFLVFSGAGMLIETGVLAVSVYVLGLDTHLEQIAAKLAGLALGTVFRFISYRTWVFKAVPEPVAVPAPAVVAEAELLLAAEEPQYVK